MGGTVYVLDPEEYAAWLEGGPEIAPIMAGGNALSTIGLHDVPRCRRKKAEATELRGILGRQVQLKDGSTATVDDAYLTESILNPTAKVVEGFSALMPNFTAQVQRPRTR